MNKSIVVVYIIIMIIYTTIVKNIHINISFLILGSTIKRWTIFEVMML